jgi:hypothetical protein
MLLISFKFKVFMLLPNLLPRVCRSGRPHRSPSYSSGCRGVDVIPPPGAEIKNACTHISALHTTSWHGAHCIARTSDEIHRNLRQNSGYLGQDLNPGLTYYEAAHCLTISVILFSIKRNDSINAGLRCIHRVSLLSTVHWIGLL